jgi:NADPH:quinone reductase-like Zn-dependent oxidoreductase
MITQAGLKSGEVMLVSAAGSGVGTAAIQLAHAMGATTVGTARSKDKLLRCRSLGLDVGVVPENGSFADRVPAPAVIVELVGGGYLAEDLRCVQTLGRIVLVGLLAGRKHELDLGQILSKRVRIFGTVMRARPLEEKIAATRAFEAQVVPLLARGTIRPIVDSVLPLADAARAHEKMASNDCFGKIVLAL